MTIKDIKQVLLNENIMKYKKFAYSGWQFIASKFCRCLRQRMSIKKQKMMLLFDDGNRRIKNALDVCEVVRAHEDVKLLKHLILQR